VCYDVALSKMIKVDGFSVPAEKDSRRGQEISQRFRKMICTSDHLDESANCEVPPIAVAERFGSVARLAGRDHHEGCCMHIAVIRKCGQGRARGTQVGQGGGNERM
jgi:hypothetical protein